jgi:hypothetical protein
MSVSLVPMEPVLSATMRSKARLNNLTRLFSKGDAHAMQTRGSNVFVPYFHWTLARLDTLDNYMGLNRKSPLGQE